MLSSFNSHNGSLSDSECVFIDCFLFFFAITAELLFVYNDVLCLKTLFLYYSAVAIPEMLNACEEKNKIDKRVSRFVIPFCVTLNADGSALFISAAAVFLATITGMSLSAADYIVIW